jgi:drug/metabolite transporter (DMT)-like permease
MAALTWAFALVLFKRCGERIEPIALNLFKNTVGLVLLGVTLLAMSDGVQVLHRFPRGDIAILLLSGVLGIALADTVFFYALNLIGVGMVSIVDSLYSPFIILFSCIILAEKLTLPVGVGTALILAAVLVCSRHTPPRDRTRGQVALGALLGACAMALMTFGIVIAKPVLDMNDFPLIWATTLRLAVGTFALALFAVASPRRKELWSVFRPSSIWKVSLPASFLGTYLSLILWMAGFKYAKASIAGVLNQTTMIFSIILATVILKESFTRRKLLAIILAAGGVAIVTMRDYIHAVLSRYGWFV